MTYIFIVLLVIISVLAFWLMKASSKDVRSMIKEYQSAFPHGCPVCGYARYGLREFGIPFNPDSHECPESDRDYRDRALSPPVHMPSALTLEEAKKKRVCRFCKLGYTEGPGLPFDFNFGKEHAHSKCLKDNQV